MMLARKIGVLFSCMLCFASCERNFSDGLYGLHDTRIAFAPGTHSETDALHIIRPDGSDMQRITELADDDSMYVGHILWSPDGQTIAYSLWRTVAPAEYAGALKLISPDGSDKRILFEVDGLIYLWGYSPDGRYLLFEYVAGQSRDRILVVLSVTGELLAEYEGGTWFTSASWSPDGRFIAFKKSSDPAGQQFKQSKVYLADPAFSEVDLLTDEPLQEIYGITWSPDGQKVIYNVAERTPETTRRVNYQVRLSERVQRTFLAQTSWMLYPELPVFSPNGQRLALLAGNPTQLYVGNADGSNVVQITDARGWHSEPQWRNNSRTIFFRRNVPGSTIWRINTDASDLRQVTPLIEGSHGLDYAVSP